MQTGENIQGLRKAIDLTRLLSMVMLALHLYHFCYAAMQQWGYTLALTDKVLVVIARTGLFASVWTAKGWAMGLLSVSLLGAKGKKDEAVNPIVNMVVMALGLLVCMGAHGLFAWQWEATTGTMLYAGLLLVGYLMVLTGGTRLTRYVKIRLGEDVFNQVNESFPQEERLLQNEYAVNLPAVYQWKGRVRKSWINIINPFRGLLIIGTPGAGKSYFVMRHVITQHLQKGYTMFVYDFKYPDLSLIVYNTLRQYSRVYPVAPTFYVINFEDLSRSHRCNPLDPMTMDDITDATESSRTIMLGLNRDWIKKQGDFFVESPINFVTAMIWFLRKFEAGRFCTLPHVIELMQLEYKVMFPLLRTEPEIEVLVNPFESAYRHEAWEQLEGQIASAKIGMARLSSPQLYYVLSGNDFTLDVNNPQDPKVVCMGNNPQKQQVYGAVLSLYVSRMIKLVNRKGRQKCSLIFDEFPTIYFNNIDSLMATARSNLVATALAVQDYSQLKKDYGRDQAEVIMNLAGNVISGQVAGDTARQLSDRFGKIVQQRESVSVNRADTSVSRSTQLDAAIPPSKIASLSSGEFVGMVGDDPMQKIQLKVFHAQIVNDHAAIKNEEDGYQAIPQVRQLADDEVLLNYKQIKEDIKYIIEARLPNQS